jgi:hypothetical protein
MIVIKACAKRYGKRKRDWRWGKKKDEKKGNKRDMRRNKKWRFRCKYFEQGSCRRSLRILRIFLCLSIYP